MARTKYIVFDFDGTISTLRYGWESIMQPLMLEMICPEGNYSPELIKKVEDYIDASTGIQTAYQMQWLAEEVEKATGKSEDVWYYKDCYNQKILDMVAEKKRMIVEGKAGRDDFLMKGSVGFLQQLSQQGCRMFLASGTDDVDVKAEAKFLGVDGYFEEIKGAPAGEFGCSKELVIRRLIEQAGDEADLVVIGDGKVEIRLGKESGALAIGIASDEEAREGINLRKQARLENAGADIIVGDFLESEKLVKMIMEGK